MTSPGRSGLFFLFFALFGSLFRPDVLVLVGLALCRALFASLFGTVSRRSRERWFVLGHLAIILVIVLFLLLIKGFNQGPKGAPNVSWDDGLLVAILLRKARHGYQCAFVVVGQLSSDWQRSGTGAIAQHGRGRRRG
jgi:ABC-type branched-subunit amino acid transport system permease subunit